MRHIVEDHRDWKQKKSVCRHVYESMGCVRFRRLCALNANIDNCMACKEYEIYLFAILLIEHLFVYHIRDESSRPTKTHKNL